MKKRLIIVMIFLWSLVTFAGETYTSLLLGDSNGKIYYSDNIDEVHPLASVTKMVNVMVVYDKIRRGEIGLKDRVLISEKARNIRGSRIHIAKGSRLTVEELIKATAIYSANNAAYALAEYAGGGDVDAFIRLMNKKAKKVGANVVFHTPMGLPPHMTGRGMDEGTARGIYLLSLEALKYPEYIKIASQKYAVIQGGQRIKNRNNLLSKEKGIYGIKTGHHSKAGYNISIVSDRNDTKAITVVFGSPSARTRDRVAARTIDRFYNEYRVRKIVDSHKAIGEIKVEKALETKLAVYPEKDIEKFVSNKWDVDIKAKYNPRIVAPVRKGDKIGEYRVLVKGKEAGRGILYAGRDIPKINVMDEVIEELFKEEKEAETN